ncbi:MAG TPA: hypothetical protein VLH15_11830 [Dehalococcoidales bacterium]|nr:hypothetical protein [Dehalococcoidales bacterium]
MFKVLIQSLCVPGNKLASKLFRQQHGQVLPIVLAVLALGAMVIGPFLNHASTALISANHYEQMINENYACEAGVEEAIWSLVNDRFKNQMTQPRSSFSYTLDEKVNNLTVDIFVTFTSAQPNSTYQIVSKAGGTVVTSLIQINKKDVSILTWNSDPR